MYKQFEMLDNNGMVAILEHEYFRRDKPLKSPWFFQEYNRHWDSAPSGNMDFFLNIQKPSRNFGLFLEIIGLWFN